MNCQDLLATAMGNLDVVTLKNNISTVNNFVDQLTVLMEETTCLGLPFGSTYKEVIGRDYQTDMLHHMRKFPVSCKTPEANQACEAFMRDINQALEAHNQVQNELPPSTCDINSGTPAPCTADAITDIKANLQDMKNLIDELICKRDAILNEKEQLQEQQNSCLEQLQDKKQECEMPVCENEILDPSTVPECPLSTDLPECPFVDTSGATIPECTNVECTNDETKIPECTNILPECPFYPDSKTTTTCKKRKSTTTRKRKGPERCEIKTGIKKDMKAVVEKVVERLLQEEMVLKSGERLLLEYKTPSMCEPYMDEEEYYVDTREEDPDLYEEEYYDCGDDNVDDDEMLDSRQKVMESEYVPAAWDMDYGLYLN